MTRAELLQQHVDAVTNKEVTWGVDDCSPWCAMWLYRAANVRVPIDLKYANREEAIQLIKSAGGLLNLWTPSLARAGVSERYSPIQYGDIGLVDTEIWGPIGVIFAANGIAVCRHECGASFLAPRAKTIVKVWALPDHDHT